ncbi:Os05g0202100 [Oryza sativa Japonica Group]|nr:Os05g0202100 [Oryza sativa Japonica Group]
MPPPEQQWRWQRLSPRAAAATSRGSGGSVLLREWQGRPPPVSGDSGSPTTSGVAASSPTTGSAAASSPNTGNGGGALPHHR